MSRKNRRKAGKKASAFNANKNIKNEINDSGSDASNAPSGSMTFSFFGQPESVLKGAVSDAMGSHLDPDEGFYHPPTPLAGLARLLRANAFHGPILEFKTNMVMRGFVPSPMVSRRVMHAVATDFNVFLNGYFQLVRDYSGDVVRTIHLPAINMRRLEKPDQYGWLDSEGTLKPFRKGEVLHIKNYDVVQNIYGTPWYLGAIQSMLLNEDATMFRRKYYLNGAHMGYIFYSSSAGLGEDDQEAIKEAIQSSKGIGNFRNMFLHLPGGREKDIQILPVGDFSTKDELEKIKNISRDDIIAAHRIPAAMASILPSGNSNFGDITKVDAVYEKNEVLPIREQLLDINDWLPEIGKVSFETQEPPV
ncbi:phage portal protein [Endozoicomonas ascidiicola]|uniref:phage portal protein n=1 Tax=Endozoicomonas ascidiicola TaxID=1698521 RepID=UPI000AF0D527|nr:phage portal protein [Endozoicomonas ascidiicola]